jgi:hypothetical protein
MSIETPHNLSEKKAALLESRQKQANADKETAYAFAEVFGREDSRTERQRKVVAMLEEYCAWERTTSISDGKPIDPYLTQQLEGRRQVMLLVRMCIKASEA